jgi:S1-C subfamily serine protease
MYVAGVGLEESVDLPVRVGQVLAGGAAEEAGVQVGDVVLSVRGLGMDELTPYQRPWAFVSDVPGEEIPATLERAGETIEVTLQARDLLTSP